MTWVDAASATLDCLIDSHSCKTNGVNSTANAIVNMMNAATVARVYRRSSRLRDSIDAAAAWTSKAQSHMMAAGAGVSCCIMVFVWV
jgi:hypothetical protein